MRKYMRGAAALLICVLLAGSACAQEAATVATAEEGAAMVWAYIEAFEQAMQHAPKGGLYYFPDLAGAVEDCTVFTEYWAESDAEAVYEERVLEALEYTVSDAPEGLIALTVTPNRSKEMDGYAYPYIIGVRNEALGITVYGYPYQALPDTLYHYSVEWTGISGDDIREMWLYDNRYLAHTDTDGEENRFELKGITNGLICLEEVTDDTWLAGPIHFVGGDLLTLQVLPWDEGMITEADGADLEGIRTAAQAFDVPLAVGESREIPLEGLAWAASATVTKHAVLREGGGLNEQIEQSMAPMASADVPVLVTPSPDAPQIAVASRLADAGMIVVHEACNIRSGPGAEYGAAGKAEAGDMFSAIGTDPNGWFVIRMSDGRFGYISVKKADYVQ